MKMSSETVRGTLFHWLAYLRRTGPVKEVAGEEPPLRAELFSSDQMKLHGEALANSHKLSPGRASDRLLPRLTENEGVLIAARNLLTEAVKAKRRIAPAGEWLLDNFYLIEEQIRTARRHLPKGYSRELPCLLNGPSAGLPARVRHCPGDYLARRWAGGSGKSQQFRGRLPDGEHPEAWRIVGHPHHAAPRPDRESAAGCRPDRRRQGGTKPCRLLGRSDDGDRRERPQEPDSVIADMARSNPPMASSFVAELTRRLQGQGPALALPLTWIEQRLSESGLTIEQLVRSENQQQAADQVSMSNSIGSLRFLGAMDWREFVETMSIVEQTLGEDPGDVYGKMDFATRDRYRHVVEKIAKNSPHSESEVARQAIQLAQEGAAEKGGDDRAAHVGFYLIDEGLTQLERMAEMRVSPAEGLRKVSRRLPLLLYGGTILLLTVIFAGCLAAKAYAGGLQGWALGLVGLLLLLCASQSGGRLGELAGDGTGDAASVAAHGFLQGDPVGIANAGGGPDDAHEHSKHRGADRVAGSPLPGQSG